MHPQKECGSLRRRWCQGNKRQRAPIGYTFASGRFLGTNLYNLSKAVPSRSTLGGTRGNGRGMGVIGRGAVRYCPIVYHGIILPCCAEVKHPQMGVLILSQQHNCAHTEKEAKYISETPLIGIILYFSDSRKRNRSSRIARAGTPSRSFQSPQLSKRIFG